MHLNLSINQERLLTINSTTRAVHVVEYTMVCYGPVCSSFDSFLLKEGILTSVVVSTSTSNTKLHCSFLLLLLHVPILSCFVKNPNTFPLCYKSLNTIPPEFVSLFNCCQGNSANSKGITANLSHTSTFL